jgi:hypothetical protein
MRAALRAVETMEPARPRRRLAGGGMSTCKNKTSRFLVDLNEKQEVRRGRRMENIVKKVKGRRKSKGVYRSEGNPTEGLRVYIVG